MKFMRTIRAALSRPASRWVRFFSEFLCDALSCILAIALVFMLTMDASFDLSLRSQLTLYVAVAIALHLLLLLNRGVYSLNPKFLSFFDLKLISLCAIVPGAVIGVAEYQLNFADVRLGPIVTGLLYGFVSTTILVLIRFGRRRVIRSSRVNRADEVLKVLIVGAGDAGETLLREMHKAQKGKREPVGFVDDNPAKSSLRIVGVPVLGSTEDIPYLADSLKIDEIFIAVPSATGTFMRRIYGLCAGTRARIRTLPSLGELLEHGPSYVLQTREIRIEDLLRREPIETNLSAVRSFVSGESVMITGGGGSIGSELARQISRLHPATIVIVGKGENSVYEIEQELIQTVGTTPVSVVADVRDRESLERILAENRPTVVFHAAAHKHVPLMQKNVREAVRNNIIGTLNVAELSVKYGVKKFVLISTDKAVHPSSVMGATKRVCEMICQALGQRTETEFAAVRFGNVLGSRGSLIPLLTAQIRRGGPVTVTHPEMTRYFMTIPEAVQLVLQAGAMGSKGEIFILDMGDPVKIEDLALELIRMHGLMPGDDIQVKYTGIRPGEKLHEELVYDKEDLKPTHHEKIRIVTKPPLVGISTLKREIEVLLELSQGDDTEAARQYLMELAWRKNTVPMLDPTVGENTESNTIEDRLS